MIDLEWADVLKCPECPGWFREDGGPDNLLVHALAEHPESELARQVRAIAPAGGNGVPSTEEARA
jgi:hypothetical protein